MIFLRHLLLIAFCLIPLSSCVEVEVEKDYKGIVINEISAHDQTVDAETWVELMNTGEDVVDITGLGLYVTDEYFKDLSIWEGRGIIHPGEKVVLSTADKTLRTGFASNAQFSLRLGGAKGVTDRFDRGADCAKTLTDRGSYQRIPDGSGTWKSLPYSSRGADNEVFDYTKYNRTAIWVWSSYISSWAADDYKVMKELYDKGYRHILLNFAAFHPNNKKTTLEFIEKAEEMGWVVHAWLQCFYNGGWINPVDDENNRYKEEIFEGIREKARSYIEEFGVKGLHLDYIRFGGTASKHNPSAEVNAMGAVNKCCKEIREVADSFDAGIVTSAALMPEINSTQYYGQSPSHMCKYLHILMPMIYRYSYNYSDASCQKVANWFADNAADAEMWSGMQTYIGNDSHVTPMDAAAIRKDLDIFMDTRGKGIVLFRYGLGTFPDVNDIK